MLDRYSVVLADDHYLFRSGLAYGLRERGFNVLAEVDSGPGAVEAVLRSSPTAALMNLDMRGYGGIEATRRILLQRPNAQVLALTEEHEPASVLGALGAGMAGFLLKDEPLDNIVSALRGALAGDAPISPRAARGLVGYTQWRRVAVASIAADPGLSDRELDVLALMSDGCCNATIAEQLTISPHTVKSHISRVLAKLQCSNRVQAVVRAHREDLLRPTSPPLRVVR